MEHFITFLKNDLTIAYIAPIFVAAIVGIGKIVTDKMRERKIGTLRRNGKKKILNVFNEYCKRNRIQPIISYGDSNALKVVSENIRGNIIVKAEINLKNLPENNEQRNFVMILLKYIPKEDMTFFYKKGYSFMFDVKSSKGISGIQLEIKDINGAKVIDEFVEVFQETKHYSFKVDNYSEYEAWEDINEICFTVFAEKEYITKKTGSLEISNCMFQKE